MSDEKFNDKKITPQKEDFSQWYLDVIEAAELADYSPVRGCMVIRPTGYAIWEIVQKTLDAKFKALGVENAYFPLLIPENFLKREAKHVEGFAPEVAVVTHAGGKELDEPLVVRPTSETIIYDSFAKWIHSYRDLPLRINQWANVVRWELRTRLFLRTTEFLWQEGHTAYATEEEADADARKMIEVYRDFAENYMAIPVLVGQKTESEKFAGALRTYCVESMTQDGKALQFGTSHNLGQNFAQAFGVKYLDQNNTEQFAWQTSWGVSTRMIGGLIMAHSDDKGLVLPPKMAATQAVITVVGIDENVIKAAEEFALKLKTNGIGVKVDSRDLRPGEKYFYWEKKGIPVRVELGPKDLANNAAVLVRRDTGEKTTVQLDNLAAEISNLLANIQVSLLEKAKQFRADHTQEANTWEEFKKLIEEGNFVLAHWDGTAETEAKIKEETAATIRCIPFDGLLEEGKCIFSGNPSKQRVVFAKSY